jgi:superfamily II DNA or RNA helicase
MARQRNMQRPKAGAARGKYLDEIEFVRNCFVLVPRNGEPFHTAIYIDDNAASEQPRVFCSCSKGGYASCEHAARLSRAWSALKAHCGESAPYEAMEQSRFAGIFVALAKVYPWVIDNCDIKRSAAKPPAATVERHDRPVIEYRSTGGDFERFCGRMSAAGAHDCLSGLMRKAEGFALSDMERAMASAGHWTTRRAKENSVWYRFMYHLWREYGEGDGIVIAGHVAAGNGDFHLVLRREKQSGWRARVWIPREFISSILKLLSQDPRCENPYRLIREQCEIRFSVIFRDKPAAVRFIPFVEVIDETRAVVRANIEDRICYGNLIFFERLNRFQPLSNASLGILSQHWDRPRDIPLAESSLFIEKNLSFFSFEPQSAGPVLDLFSAGGGDDLGRIEGARIIQGFDRIELTPTRIGMDSCELSAMYISGDTAVPLSDIIDARNSGRRFIAAGGCIFDLKTVALARLGKAVASTGKEKGLKLSRAALLQLRAGGALRLSLDESLPGAAALRSMMELRPARPLNPLRGLKSMLRPYQKNGVSWLLFLWDNAFGGLLCDEMGLGKTHQVLGLIAALREQRDEYGPCLVVCPSTVLPHWQRLATQYAPGMRANAVHGIARDWDVADISDIIITTYGIVRADGEQIAHCRFALAIFDEAQNIKNPSAQVSIAARMVAARVKICLTGTPVENSTADLKALMDLVMPEYLGDDEGFVRDFVQPIEEGDDTTVRTNLRRLTEPFVLRRMKRAVLDDLPPKIEDIYTCGLHREQHALYRELVDTRGGPLLAALRNNTAPIPYIDILSLLTHLKQLCDHPAVLAKKPADFERHQSGKWELFCELLEELLGSGQKAVVYSQYLDMIEIIRRYLQSRDIGHAVLTGASRKRGEIVQHFADDDRCRVFVGSLKAGGSGIDLTAASAVIHYDRWWNAAREDQATDRVHRIGQTRGVQVLKLVTKNTLEEKIHSLIESRRELARSVLAEDSPDTIKSFSRHELIEILRY